MAKSEDAPLRARRPLSGCAITAIALGVFVVLVAVATLMTGSLLMNQADRRIEGLLKEAKSRPSARPVLYREEVPGNAWDDYTAAWTEIKALKIKSSVLSDYVSGARNADRAAVEAVVAATPKVLERLHQGAHKDSSQCPFDWEKPDESGPSLLASGNLNNLAVCRARLLREQGKTREAMELLLDAVQFGCDVGRDMLLIHEMIGIAHTETALNELHDLVTSRQLSREDLALLERAMETLDGNLPLHARSLTNEALYIGVIFKKDHESRSVFGKVWSGLLYGHSVTRMDRFYKRLADAQSMRYADLRRVSDEVEKDAQASWNPVIRIAAPNVAHERGATRRNRARLRLLRAAAHFQATGEALEIDDPFGEKLKHSREGDTLKVWSLGSDGTDNGGIGTWKAADGKDLVLTVEQTP